MANFTLELHNLLAESWLSDVGSSGGPGEVFRFRDRDEVPQLVQFHSIILLKR
jgi:hypothetical protein